MSDSATFQSPCSSSTVRSRDWASMYLLCFNNPSIHFPFFAVVQPPSRSTLCDPTDCSTPGLPIPHRLPKLARAHVHCIGDAIQPSHPLDTPFSFCLQAFPASGTFPISRLFASDDQNTGASAFRASLAAQMVNNLPAVPETRLRSLGWEDPLEKGMATHSSVLAWRIPWTEEPGRLQSMGSHPTERLTLSLSQ